MPKPVCSRDEFIRTWKECKGNAEIIAKRLGVAVRNVYDRRRRIEESEGFALNSLIDQHAPRLHAEVEDGTVIVFSDAHFQENVDTAAYRALLLLIKKLKPKIIVNNGDSFDGGAISRHPRIGWSSAPTVLQELRACEDHLRRIERLADGVDLFWPLGNHDARYETRLAAVAPENEGVPGFTLKSHFEAWRPCWSLWINDDVVIKHQFKGGIHATHNNTMWAGKHMVTGHLHSLKVTPFSDYNGTVFGVDTGTLADPYSAPFVHYTEDSPVNWRSGFAVLTFREKRLLWPEICRTLGPDTVDFRGQIIKV